jgi:small subunit ribosomal protein S6
MRRYETIFIIRPTIAEDEITGIIEKVNSIIDADGGTFIKVDKWGLKKLAYLIKKESQGHYVYVDYASVSASVAEMERIFRIDDRVLKYLTVKLADSCDPDAIKELLAQEEQAAEASVAEAEEAAETPAQSEEAAEAPAETEETAVAPAEAEEVTEAPAEAEEIAVAPAEAEEVTEAPAEAEEIAEAPAEAEEIAEAPAEAEETAEEETSAAAEEEKAE